MLQINSYTVTRNMDENMLKEMRPILYAGKIFGFVYFSFGKENWYTRILNFAIPAPFLFLYLFSCYNGLPFITKMDVGYESKIFTITDLTSAMLCIAVVSFSASYFMFNRNEHKQILFDISKLRNVRKLTAQKKHWKICANYIYLEVPIIIMMDRCLRKVEMSFYCYFIYYAAGCFILIQQTYVNQIYTELHELLFGLHKQMPKYINKHTVQQITSILKLRKNVLATACAANKTFGIVTGVSLCWFLVTCSTKVHYFIMFILTSGTHLIQIRTIIWEMYLFHRLRLLIHVRTSIIEEVSSNCNVLIIFKYLIKNTCDAKHHSFSTVKAAIHT